MTQAKAKIPVVWETTSEEIGRLLGNSSGLLDRTIALANDLTIARKWPLNRIRVEIYQDPEIVWEHLLVILVFDCGSVRAERLWDEFLDATQIIELELNERELDLFIRMISYEFECNPQL